MGKPVLVVDGGDLFGPRNLNERHQTEFLCGMCAGMGLDAIGLGEQDLNYGLDFLLEMIGKHGLPFTNANVRRISTGKLVLPEFLVVERGGIKFGFVSVLDPDVKIVTMTTDDGDFEILDPVTVLRELIPRLRTQADTVVLLGHLGDAKTDLVIKEIQGVDICVNGHTYRNNTAERVLNDAAMLSASYEGRYLGMADLFINKPDGKVMAVSVEVTAMDEAVESDQETLAKVEAYKAELQAFKEAKRAAFPRTFGSDQEEFLGDRACKSCHEDAWTVYSQSGHLQAYTTLRMKGQNFEPECLSCHTTGYQHKNGYSEDPPNNRLINVQCEACHGYGTEHARDGKWVTQARESCVICHDQKNSPNFDYASYWEKIKH